MPHVTAKHQQTYSWRCKHTIRITESQSHLLRFSELLHLIIKQSFITSSDSNSQNSDLFKIMVSQYASALTLLLLSTHSMTTNFILLLLSTLWLLSTQWLLSTHWLLSTYWLLCTCYDFSELSPWLTCFSFTVCTTEECLLFIPALLVTDFCLLVYSLFCRGCR